MVPLAAFVGIAVGLAWLWGPVALIVYSSVVLALIFLLAAAVVLGDR